MKQALFLLPILFYFSQSFGSTIAVGIVSDKIDIWRYWEKADTGYQYKMIVFNISDSAVTFSLEQWTPFVSEKHQVLISKILIDKSEYKIYDIPFNSRKCFSFYVNDSHIGNLCMEAYSYPVNISQDKFISDEGLNGRDCGFWVSKNNLFTKSNVKDTLMLHIYYDPKARLEYDGTLKLEIKPSMDYQYFTATINDTASGTFNIKGKYKIELPYNAEYNEETHKEINSNKKTDIQIVYSVKVLNKFFIGLDCKKWIDFVEKYIVNNKPFYRRNQHYEVSELPVFVQE